MDPTLARQDIDTSIKRYKDSPSSEDYFYIRDWYQQVSATFPDLEYLTCVYLFLLGANIRRRHSQFTLEQHKEWIKEIKELIEDADPLSQTVRKMYLDHGLKA